VATLNPRVAADESPEFASELLPLVSGELRRLAAHKLVNEAPAQTLQTVTLVHEARLYEELRDGE